MEPTLDLEAILLDCFIENGDLLELLPPLEELLEPPVRDGAVLVQGDDRGNPGGGQQDGGKFQMGSLDDLVVEFGSANVHGLAWDDNMLLMNANNEMADGTIDDEHAQFLMDTETLEWNLEQHRRELDVNGDGIDGHVQLLNDLIMEEERIDYDGRYIHIYICLAQAINLVRLKAVMSCLIKTIKTIDHKN